MEYILLNEYDSIYYPHLTLNPSPEGEGLKNLTISVLLPFSLRRRGWGMRR
jgi:hypothetical protein